MNAVDDSVLLHRYDTASPLHEEACRLVGALLDDGGLVVHADWLEAFADAIRNPGIARAPLAAGAVREAIDTLLSSDAVSVVRSAGVDLIIDETRRDGTGVFRRVRELERAGVTRLHTSRPDRYRDEYALDVAQLQAQSPTANYGRQWVDAADVAAVAYAVGSDRLTCGPLVERFEEALAGVGGSAHAVAVSNGTAALHCLMYGLGVGPGDEVVVPAITFSATASVVSHLGGRPVFCDVSPDTLLIDVEAASRAVTPRTKAVVAVDYAGQPCDYDGLRSLADRHGLALIADACHSLGGSYKGRSVGSLADATVFSFHPVKHVTTGEGGALLTDDERLAARARAFRSHGMTTLFGERESSATWRYDIGDIGLNYRLTDIQCALGLSQLKKLSWFLDRRRQMARRYFSELASLTGVTPLAALPDRGHAYHLFVVRLDSGTDRTALFRQLRERSLGVNVHYIPLHTLSFYQKHLQTRAGLCPHAEEAYERILSLPLHPGMEECDVEHVCETVKAAVASNS